MAAKKYPPLEEWYQFIEGDALTSVTINNSTYGGEIINWDAQGGPHGETLKEVVINGVSYYGSYIDIYGNAIDNITIKNMDFFHMNTINNDKSTSLTYHIENVQNLSLYALTEKVKEITFHTVNGNNHIDELAGNFPEAQLKFTGPGNLQLDYYDPFLINAIDGSAATGDLTLFTDAGIDITTGSGNDTLLRDQYLPAPVLADVTIDGGAGIDTVDAFFITEDNASHFHNFERIAILGDNPVIFDTDWMTKSSIGGYTLMGSSAANVLNNVSVHSVLTVKNENNGSLVVNFKDANGTSDAFTIAFVGVENPTPFASNVSLEGVEHLNIVTSVSAHGSNYLELGKNSNLQTIVVSGDEAFTLEFTADNHSKDVQLVDASAANGSFYIDLHNLPDTAELTVKGGSGQNTLRAGTASVTFTEGVGENVFDVTASRVSSDTVVAAKIVTISNMHTGDTIHFGNAVNDIQKINLDATTSNMDDAFSQIQNVGSDVLQWFHYDNATWLVSDTDGSGSLTEDDTVVKFIGEIDLTGVSVSGGSLVA